MPIRINLLSEVQAAEQLRRNDPVKRGIWIAGFLITLVLLWLMKLQCDIWFEQKDLAQINNRWAGMKANYVAVTNNVTRTAEIDVKLAALDQLTTNRFLWAPVLNALQKCVVNNVEVIRLRGEQLYVKEDAKEIGTGSYKKTMPGAIVEKTSLYIDAKDTDANQENYTRFKERLCNSDYFARSLGRRDGFVFDGTLSAPTTDPSDPGRTYVTFSLASHFPRGATMNKLSKQQQERLAVIAVATVAIIGALWYFGVRAKQAQLQRTKDNTRAVMNTLRDAEAEMSRGLEIATQLQARTDLLSKKETTLAPDRDAYAWIIGQINPFIQARRGVSIYAFSQPEVSEVGILPNFPYKWATFHLKGTGYYYEFGRFFADLENEFPYFRVQNLAIGVNNTPGVDFEKLAYTFDLVVPMTSSDVK